MALFTDLSSQKDNRVMKLLGLKEIRHLVAQTSKGDLTCMLHLGESAKDYRFVLDAVPTSDEVNDQIKELLK